MSNPIIAIDGHVHVHPSTDVDALLDAARTNLSKVAASQGAASWRGVLMLAEMRGTHWFESVVAAGADSQRWSVRAVPEDQLTLSARCAGGELSLVAGRQVVTREGIEVLTLATRAVLEDRMTLDDTLEAAHAAQAVVVLPWGAGKWLGARGRLVANALKAPSRGRIFAGDNGGRPQFWPTPDVFVAATGLGRAVLPGTDPLPLPGEELRVGTFGFWLEGTPPLAVGQWLRDRLATAGVSEVHAFGRLQGTLRFMRNQTALRMRPKPGRGQGNEAAKITTRRT